MLPFKEIHVLDKNAEALGVPTAELMENAGRAVAEVALEEFPTRDGPVTVVCGSGNNAGDGLVAARYLSGKARVKVVLLRGEKGLRSELTSSNLRRLPEDVEVVECPEDLAAVLAGSSLIIDALLGVGIRGEVREPYASAIAVMNASGTPILSIDVPSGLGTATPLHPAATVTLHDAKEGMDEDNSGRIIVRSIGIPEAAETHTGPGEFTLYPRPAWDAHKGDSGRVLVVGGGPFTGAPALSALAAYSVGADLVHLAVPSVAYEVVASFSPSFIVHRAGEAVLGSGEVPAILERAEDMDALIVGPGAGLNPVTLKAMRKVLAAVRSPAVVDADGLKAVAEDLTCLEGRKVVLTPHAGEFEVLRGERLRGGMEDRVAAAEAFSKEWDVCLTVKGPVDIITDGERTKLNKTGCPAMTVGGTGDVLAGAVGGLIAKGMEPFDAARLGAWITGTAGEWAFARLSYGLTASDVASLIPEILKAHL